MEDKKEKEIRQLRADLNDSRKETADFSVRFDLASNERDHYQSEVKQLKNENSSLKRELNHLRGIVKQMGVFIERTIQMVRNCFRRSGMGLSSFWKT